MKLAYFLCLFFSLFAQWSTAQHIGKKDASAILDKMMVHLKVGDEIAFSSLWSRDPVPGSNQVDVTMQELKEHFKEMKQFLDTALAQNMRPEEIKVEKVSDAERKEFGAYSRIFLYFLYAPEYRKGVALYVTRKEEQWLFRSSPEYLVEIVK